jgi:hypothetical protein
MLVLCAIFLGFYAAHVYLDSQLVKTQTQVGILMAKLEAFGTTQEMARDISKRVARYKSLEQSRRLLTPKVETLFASVKNFKFDSLSLKADGFTLVGTCRALDCSNMITALVKNGIVSRVAIKSAAFSEKQAGIVVELEGIFK